jgi:hypothetical protein
MTLRRLFSIFLLLLSLTACAPIEGTQGEPINGCLLAAANRREIYKAKAYLNPGIASRILRVGYRSGKGHALLVYRLDDCWWVYDDQWGSRRLSVSPSAQFPSALLVALQTQPPGMVVTAQYLD